MTGSTNNAPSWGRLIQTNRVIAPYSAKGLEADNGSLLPYGNGRSYGDSCHNDAGTLIDSRSNNRIVSFDAEVGVLEAESGILLSQLLQFLKDKGWFLPVVPGTKFVTLGGAIANDIHGKNHGLRGTFGHHVKRLNLARSDKDMMECSATKNASFFNATIGGMGLTGVIVSAQIQLIRVPSHLVRETKRKFNSLSEFITLNEPAESTSEYSVAWVDSLATGKKLGRGIMIFGDHIESDRAINYGDPKLKVPFTPPVPMVSGLPLQAFNLAYFHRNAGQIKPRIATPDSFFFPLDAIGGWNKLYGTKGLYQHQCVIPENNARDVLSALIRASQLAKHGSFLTVLKKFGNRPSPGLLSFPKPGFTLTLDFPNRGEKTHRLLEQLDAIVLDADGRTNPYKDGRMSAGTFQQGFTMWRDLEALRDPAMMSDFWRRVTNRTSLVAPSLETPVEDINQASKPAIQEQEIQG